VQICGTALSETRRAEYALHLPHFRTLITFEEIEKRFPEVALGGPSIN
jgi:hypothetical protein